MFRRILYVLIGLIVLAALATAWVVATSSGLRAALAVADRFLPAALTLGSAEGTLVSGVELTGPAWRDEAVHVEIDGLRLVLDAGPLLRGDLRLALVKADGVRVRLLPTEPSEPAADGPFAFRMPVPLEIVDGRIVSLSIAGEDWSREFERIELQAAMRGADLTVSHLRIGSDWLDVDVAGSGRVESPYPIDIAGSWAFRLEDGQEFAGSGSVRGDEQGYALSHGLRRPLAIRSRGSLRLAPAGPRAIISNDWERIEWPLADGRTLVALSGQLTVEGWLDAYRFGADSRLALEGLPESQVDVAGDGGPGRLVLSELSVVGEAGRLRAEGSVEILPALSWDARFAAEEVKPELLGAPIEAVLTAAGSSRGRLAEGQPVFDLELDTLSGTYAGLAAEGEGVLRYGAGITAFESFTLAVGDNRVRADGRVGEAIGLDLAVDAPRLDELWPGLEGSVAGEVRLGGRLAAPQISGSLEARGITLGPVRAGRVLLSGVGDGGAGSRLSIEASELLVAGRTVQRLQAELRGSPAENELELVAEADGATLSLEAAGTLTESEWSGQLVDLELLHPLLGPWRLLSPAYLAVAASGVELGDACLGGDRQQRVCVGASASDADGLRATADAERLRLQPLEQFFPPGTLIDGRATASAEFVLQDGRVNGEARLEVPRAVVQTRLDEEELTEIRLVSLRLNALIEDNRTTLTAALDLGPDGQGTARLISDDLLDADAGLEGEIALRFTDLELVSLLVPELDQVQGLLEGRLAIAGSRRSPLLDGSILLSDGSFEFPAAGIRVTDIRILAAQDRAGRISYEGEARSGEGTAAIRGESRYGEETGWVSELTLRGDDFLIARLPDLEATASPDLMIRIDQRQVGIRGRLTVPSADITLRDLGIDAVAPSPDAVVHGAGEEGAAEERPQTLSIDLEVVLGDAVKLQGFGLQTELEGALRLTGGSDAPWLGYGRVRLVGGRYKAYGQRLTVERGELAFSGPLDNPVLDIRATRQAGDVVAGIQVTGTVRSPRSTVFSEPALSEAEALSYLLTGRPLAGASSSDGNLIASAALSLGLSQAGSVAAQVRQSIGLDTFAIEGGSTDGRVLAGKRLGPDLYVQYAYGLFDKIGTLLVSYRLSERLALESRSGEYHALDFIYRVRKD